jgi:hypothetical protein
MHKGMPRTRVFSVTDSWEMILEYSPNRTAILFTNLGTIDVALCFGNPYEGNLAVGQGHIISQSNSPFRLDGYLSVHLVRGPVYASTTAGTAQLVVSESYVCGECLAEQKLYRE